MSNLAVGPAFAIDGPLPRPPEYRLLAVPGVLQTGDREMNGVSVWGYPCDTPSLWDPCFAEGTFGTKLDTHTQEEPSFWPFAAYVPFTCSTITANPAEFARRAEAVIEATISHAVEQALAHGVLGNNSPYFGDGNLVPLGGGGVLSPDFGLAYLEDAIGATGRQGMIHATPGIISAWGFDKLETDGVLRTTNGTLVVRGSGLQGSGSGRRAGSGSRTGLGLRNRPGGGLHRGVQPAGHLRVRRSLGQHGYLQSREVRCRRVGHLPAGGRSHRLGQLGTRMTKVIREEGQ